MQSMKKQLVIATVALGLTLSSGLLPAQEVIIGVAPPRPRYERRPPPPREHRDWAWRPGYYRWDGHTHVWVAGEYAAPPRPHARWVPGHWDRRPHGYVWVEGRWR
jgi:hypothetical protein